MKNPFKPSFGVTPPVLVGRSGVIEAFVEALDDGPGSSGRATLYTGARGSGKTVMLNAVEDRARERGWIVLSETASPGFIDRMTRQQLPKLLGELDPDAIQRRLTGATAPLGVGALAWSARDVHVAQAGLRNQVALLTDVLATGGTGLLITLDEIHQNQIGELRELVTTVQHGFREERQIAFAGAGLASAISEIVNDDVLTFLRRAERYSLGPVGHEDVARALRGPVEAGGRHVDEEALSLMANGTHGYPFLIQLVGAQTWRLRPTAPDISLADAEQGVVNARRRLGTLVHEPALAHISAVDNTFLLAMARDDGPSKMGDIEQRLGVDRNYASQYRLRLIAAELIEPTGHGYVDFALPYLRDYLREHAAASP